MALKECENCGKPFHVYPSNANLKNCSQLCRTKLKPIECPTCKLDFKPRNSTQKFCSHNCYALSLQGNKPWNKGLVGYFAGEKHYNWKGGQGTIRHQEMSRSAYRNWRSAVLIRDNYSCQICYDYGVHLHADHIKSWADNPSLRYDINNGRALCRACHFYITFKRKMPVSSKWGLTTATRKQG